MRGTLSDLPLGFHEVSHSVGPVQILRDISLQVLPGAPTAVIGPNGCGKTTLLRLAMGLLPPTHGEILWGGRWEIDVSRRAMLFQRPVLLRRSVAENIAYALKSIGKAPARATIEALIAQVGLDGLADRPARRLSGGEQQKLALARALARNPELLILDEPTAALDPAATHAVETIIADAAARGIKILFASHDLAQVRRLAGEVHLLVAGRLIESAPVSTFFSNPATPEAAAFLRGDLLTDV